MAPEIIGSIAGAGLSTLGSLLGASYSQDYNRENMALQAENARALAEYQWKNFGSPEAQLRSFNKAGLSANAFLGGKGSAAQPSMTMPSSAPVSVDGIMDLGNIASYIQSVANAKKAGMDTKLSEQEIKNKEIQRQRDEFELQLRKVFGKEQISSELANSYMQLILASDQSDLNEIQKAIGHWNELKAKAESKTSEHQRDMAKQLLDNNPTAIKLENRLKELQGSAAAASAEASRASAEQSRASAKLIASQQWQQDYYNQMRDAPEVRNSVFMELKSFGVAAERENVLKGEQIEQLKYVVSQAMYADNMKEYTYWIDKATSILGTAATVAGASALLKHYHSLDKALGMPKVSTTENFGWNGEKVGSSVTKSY